MTRTTETQARPPGPLRSPHVLAIFVQLAECGVCRAAGPANPCVRRESGPDGMHLARFTAACRRGLITSEELGSVIWARHAAAGTAVVWDDAFGQAAR